jgi:hypothetical protein
VNPFQGLLKVHAAPPFVATFDFARRIASNQVQVASV